MVLADEGVNGNIVRELRKLELQIDWIQEIRPGISDEQVIEFAKKNRKILITEDKDFGEWIFAHKIKGLSIIFLRYEKSDLDTVTTFLKQLILQINQEELIEPHQFITISKNKVRRRKI